MEIPAALVSQRVERTVAEQAIEVLLRHTLVTGELLTGTVLEERVRFVPLLREMPVKCSIAAAGNLIELLNVSVYQHFFRRPRAVYNAVPDANHRVGELPCQSQIMEREHHRDVPLPRQLPQEGQQLDLIAHVEVGRGLIQHQHLRLLTDGAGEHHALTLPVAERFKVAFGEVVDADHAHRSLHHRAVMLGEDAEGTRVRVAPEAHDIAHGQPVGAHTVGGQYG